MEAGESTLKNLNEGEKQFQVPLYQRAYSWETPQLAQLWDDILEQYDLITPTEAGVVDYAASTHFVGSMVLAPSPDMQAHGVTPFLVIDGQQRLTTLLVAICALRDVAIDDRAEERFNERYLINKFGEGDKRYRLFPTQIDRPAYFSCINNLGHRGNDLISRAYAFFRARLTQAGPDGVPLDIDRLETVIRERLQFVAVTCGPNDNVHRIFESLNDRGIRLTQADLLRNYVFMLLPTRGEDIYNEVWLPMQQGLTPTQLETLVFVDLVMRGNASVKRQDIYRAQVKRLEPLESDEVAIELEVRDLARKAELFKKVLEPERNKDHEIQGSLRRLNSWGAATTYPLLLHLFDKEDRGECSRDEIAEVLQYVESFLVRRMLGGVPTNNLNRIFAPIVQQLPADVPIAEGVRGVLSGARRYWPSDRRLRETILSNPFYFQGRPRQRMLVFRRLEDSYKHGEPVDWEAASLSIEHVMPQSLTGEWRESIKQAGDDPDVVHEELLHTLGNLTITAYNGQLSNHPFERKKEILKNSNFELNRHIVPEASWGRTEIVERAEELAKRAAEIWPPPLPGIEEPEGGKDWSRLDAALAALPPGTWTSYSDAAELVASHQVPVGQHLATTGGILNAYRVLTTEGRSSPNFHWLDAADTRDVRSVLEEDDVRFDAEGRADPAQRLSANELAELIGEVIEPSGEGETQSGWRLRRLLRYLQHFYDAPGGRLSEDEARQLAVVEGYDVRGTAGFYQGAHARLRVEGENRVLTETGHSFFEERRYLIEDA
jgi:alkylated DNA nucleotide flippase Atl1